MGTAIVPLGCGTRPHPLTSENGGDELARFPGKVAMRVVNDRPPCLETPWEYYRHDLTPNEAFYVRWHLQMIPTEIDLRTWRLSVGGVSEATEGVARCCWEFCCEVMPGLPWSHLRGRRKSRAWRG